MKITTCWAWAGDDREMPYLCAAYDEFTFDAHGDVPDFYTEDVAKAGGQKRELVLSVPDSTVTGLFEPPIVAARPV